MTPAPERAAWVPAWEPLVPLVNDVPARPDGMWTLVAEYVPGPALLKISVATYARWSYSDSRESQCGANGDPRSFIDPTTCLFKDAPVGTLIGKLGGSTTGPADSAVTFAVGSFCIVEIKQGGPLFLTINDRPDGMDNNAYKMTGLTMAWSPTPPTAHRPSSLGRS